VPARLTRPVVSAIAAVVVAIVVALLLVALGGDDEPALLGTEAQITGTTAVTGADASTTSVPAPATTRVGASSTTRSSAPSTTRLATTSTTRPSAEARPATTTASRVRDDAGLLIVAPAQLPPEARTTLRLIESGGPFPFSRDGIVFENREGLLPKKERGYYREYTVITPGESDRGARRIVAGRDGQRYYTADHYDSFVRVQT
jgi:ribonuclease T1